MPVQRAGGASRSRSPGRSGEPLRGAAPLPATVSPADLHAIEARIAEAARERELLKQLLAHANHTLVDAVQVAAAQEAEAVALAAKAPALEALVAKIKTIGVRTGVLPPSTLPPAAPASELPRVSLLPPPAAAPAVAPEAAPAPAPGSAGSSRRSSTASLPAEASSSTGGKAPALIAHGTPAWTGPGYADRRRLARREAEEAAAAAEAEARARQEVDERAAEEAAREAAPALAASRVPSTSGGVPMPLLDVDELLVAAASVPVAALHARLEGLGLPPEQVEQVKAVIELARIQTAYARGGAAGNSEDDAAAAAAAEASRMADEDAEAARAALRSGALSAGSTASSRGVSEEPPLAERKRSASPAGVNASAAPAPPSPALALPPVIAAAVAAGESWPGWAAAASAAALPLYQAAATGAPLETPQQVPPVAAAPVPLPMPFPPAYPAFGYYPHPGYLPYYPMPVASGEAAEGAAAPVAVAPAAAGEKEEAATSAPASAEPAAEAPAPAPAPASPPRAAPASSAPASPASKLDVVAWVVGAAPAGGVRTIVKAVAVPVPPQATPTTQGDAQDKKEAEVVVEVVTEAPAVAAQAAPAPAEAEAAPAAAAPEAPAAPAAADSEAAPDAATAPEQEAPAHHEEGEHALETEEAQQEEVAAPPSPAPKPVLPPPPPGGYMDVRRNKGKTVPVKERPEFSLPAGPHGKGRVFTAGAKPRLTSPAGRGGAGAAAAAASPATPSSAAAELAASLPPRVAPLAAPLVDTLKTILTGLTAASPAGHKKKKGSSSAAAAATTPGGSAHKQPGEADLEARAIQLFQIAQALAAAPAGGSSPSSPTRGRGRVRAGSGSTPAAAAADAGEEPGAGYDHASLTAAAAAVVGRRGATPPRAASSSSPRATSGSGRSGSPRLRVVLSPYSEAAVQIVQQDEPSLAVAAAPAQQRKASASPSSPSSPERRAARVTRGKDPSAASVAKAANHAASLLWELSAASGELDPSLTVPTGEAVLIPDALTSRSGARGRREGSSGASVATATTGGRRGGVGSSASRLVSPATPLAAPAPAPAPAPLGASYGPVPLPRAFVINTPAPGKDASAPPTPPGSSGSAATGSGTSVVSGTSPGAASRRLGGGHTLSSLMHSKPPSPEALHRRLGSGYSLSPSSGARGGSGAGLSPGGSGSAAWRHWSDPTTVTFADAHGTLHVASPSMGVGVVSPDGRITLEMPALERPSEPEFERRLKAMVSLVDSILDGPPAVASTPFSSRLATVLRQEAMDPLGRAGEASYGFVVTPPASPPGPRGTSATSAGGGSGGDRADLFSALAELQAASDDVFGAAVGASAKGKGAGAGAKKVAAAPVSPRRSGGGGSPAPPSSSSARAAPAPASGAYTSIRDIAFLSPTLGAAYASAGLSDANSTPSGSVYGGGRGVSSSATTRDNSPGASSAVHGGYSSSTPLPPLPATPRPAPPEEHGDASSLASADLDGASYRALLPQPLLTSPTTAVTYSLSARGGGGGGSSSPRQPLHLPSGASGTTPPGKLSGVSSGASVVTAGPSRSAFPATSPRSALQWGPAGTGTSSLPTAASLLASPLPGAARAPAAVSIPSGASVATSRRSGASLGNFAAPTIASRSHTNKAASGKGGAAPKRR